MAVRVADLPYCVMMSFVLLVSIPSPSRSAEPGHAADALSHKVLPPEVVLSLPPQTNNPRNSEGDFIQLRDGRILFIYSHFLSGNGGDHDSADLRARTSTDGGQSWSETEQTVVSNQGGMNVMSVSLLRLASGEIALFYVNKVSLTDCRPELRISSDEARSWSPPIACITDHIGYYVLNNDRAVQLADGRLVLPVCLHRLETDEKADWQGQSMCYLSDDGGRTWRRSKTVLTAKNKAGARIFAQEPGVVELHHGRSLMFARSDVGCQLLSFSEDGCETWSPYEESNIQSPRSPASIERIPATGDLLLVWNDHAHIAPELKQKRTPLTVAVSNDDGKTWQHVKNLYDNPNGWYCYSAIEFVGENVLIGHCAGDRTKNNGLAESIVTKFNLAWLYQD